MEARKEELSEVVKHNVYKKVPIAQCIERTGDDAKQLEPGGLTSTKGTTKTQTTDLALSPKSLTITEEMTLFAATPPLEAVKMLLSCAVTEGIGYNTGATRGMKLDFIDVRRAYYHADALREVYVSLPPGDEEEGMCGLLVKSLQGTRDAAQNWEAAYSNLLVSNGFTKGKATPCMFYHKARKLRVVVQGDHFTLLGDEGELDWFRKMIQKRFEVTFRGRIGPGPRDAKEYQTPHQRDRVE
jgi:hypothetical protein